MKKYHRINFSDLNLCSTSECIYLNSSIVFYKSANADDATIYGASNGVDIDMTFKDTKEIDDFFKEMEV
jgi:hypothetical protein